MPKPKRKDFGFRLTIVILAWLLLLLTVTGDVAQAIRATDIVEKVFYRALGPLTLVVVLYKTQFVGWTWRFITNTLPEAPSPREPSPQATPAEQEAAAKRAREAKAEQQMKELAEMLRPPTKRERLWDLASWLIVPLAFGLYLVIRFLATGK